MEQLPVVRVMARKLGPYHEPDPPPPPRERREAPGLDGPRTAWVKTDWFCMACGARDCWQEARRSSGDYYHEREAKCFTCGHAMCCVPEVDGK